MAVSVTVTGQNRAHVLGKRLKALGNKELTKELQKGVRNGAKKIPTAVKQAVPDYMPSGYAPVLARSLQFRTKNLASGLTVQATAKGNPRPRRITAIDAGTLRHPLWGNRRHWYAQRVRAGFFTEPAENSRDAVRAELEKVLHDVAEKIVS